MVVGRLILGLLYTNKKLNEVSADSAPGVVVEFVTKFRTKLSNIVDNHCWFMEYAIAALLDPRQRGLRRYQVIWGDLLEDDYCNWLPIIRDHYGDYYFFVEQVQ